MQNSPNRRPPCSSTQLYHSAPFAQRPGALKEFVNHVLGDSDDITRFEYMQKHNKETGPALVGIELQTREDYQKLVENLNRFKINYTELKSNDNAYNTFQIAAEF